MNRGARIAMFLLAGLVSSAALPAQTGPWVLDGGTLVFTDGRPPQPDGVVLIEGELIVAAGSREEVAIPEGARRFDVSGRWVIPGLIDAHVHFFQSGGLYTRPDAIDLRKHRPYAEELRIIRERLDDAFLRYLRCGVTAVLDCGGPEWNYRARERARKTDLAPHVAVAGPLIATYEPPQLRLEGHRPIHAFTEPGPARALVRKEVADGTDFIKIWFIVRRGQKLEELRPVVTETIEEAKKAGKRVLVHATELEAARAAVEDGADVLVHSVREPVDDAFIALLVERKVVYIPTLMVSQGYTNTFSGRLLLDEEELRWADPSVIATLFELPDLPRAMVPAMVRMMRRRGVTRAVSPVEKENLRRIHEAGVTVATGTDAGNIGTLHGPSIFREMRYMADAGLSARDVLVTATRGGAAALGESDRRGDLKAGMIADIVVLERDPLKGTENLKSIDQLVRAGSIYRAFKFSIDSPRQVLLRRVNALNAGHLNAWLACFHDEVELIDGPSGEVLARGKEALAKRFDQLPSGARRPHVRTAGRLGDGRLFVDHEVSTFDGKTTKKMLVFEFEDGRIRRLRRFVE